MTKEPLSCLKKQRLAVCENNMMMIEWAKRGDQSNTDYKMEELCWQKGLMGILWQSQLA